MKFGLAFKPPFSLQEVLQASRIADQEHLDFIMVDDELPGPDVWTLLGVIARTTNRVKLGPSLTNPHSRHPLISWVMITQSI
jgi:alkanesulfonate monooxygenase SsuD/methylene tetrahydromethanopterin reductase-like flavin-dependent oxidoreductase (luciferase family)